MKASQFLISTLKEAPADAEVVSHQLMMRAGMIKRLGAGIYNYMPMGLRVIRKVEAIVREEMNRAGAIEMTMPVVQPAELWQETGRFDKMGPELLRIKDRHGRDFVIQPTSEEVVTDVVRQEVRSYKQLPKNFYQIQTKFRDERRPRFGLMRGREFIMKDAYSFHADEACLKQTYGAMDQAYRRIFSRCGLRAVADDNAAALSIGIPLRQILVVVWATAGVVALVAGMMWGARSGVQFALVGVALKAMPVLIIGGFTSVPGVIVGGLIVGVAEKMAEVYVGPFVGGGIEGWLPYALAVFFLLVRPEGLFGEKIIRRV